MASGRETPFSEHTPLLSRSSEDLEAQADSQEAGSTVYAVKPAPKAALDPLTENTKWQRMKYYFPVADWLPNYQLSWLSGDILGGLTVACVLIPQSISYASSLARLSPVAGLFSAAVPGIVYSLFGSSKQLNVAPEAALSLLVGQAVASAIRGDPHTRPMNPDAIGVEVTTMITFQAGIITFLLGFLRLGFIDVVLSRALLRGFVTAIATVIAIEQLIPMFGLAHLEHKLNPQTTLEKFMFLVENVGQHANRATTLISFSSFGILILIRLIKKRFQERWFIYRVPEVLLVVVISTILSDIYKWDEEGVEILGSVPIKTGDHFFEVPLKAHNLRYFKDTLSTAIFISVVGFLDSIVAAKTNAARFEYSISPNRELVALGAGNLVGSMIPGTLPAYGSITRSKMNGDAGARSQMTSAVCSVIVLLATFFMIPSLYYLPKCVLAAVINLIVVSLFAEAPHDIRFFWKMRGWVDLTLMGLIFFCTFVWDVEVGIVAAMVLSLLLVVHKSSRPRMTILGRVPGTRQWKPINEDPDAEEEISAALIVRIRDSLDFANTAQLKERLRRLELYGPLPNHPSEAPRRPTASVLVFHMADVESCDASAAQILYELLETNKARRDAIFITHLRPQVRKTFEKAGIIDLLGEDSFHKDVNSAMSRISMVEFTEDQ